MTDDLTHYLDSIDPRLVDHLDADGNISVDSIRRVQRYVLALIQELLVPEQVHEDWPDFFLLVNALALADGSGRLNNLARRTSIFKGWGDEPLTDRDRAFLVALMNTSYERLVLEERHGDGGTCPDADTSDG